MTKRKVRKKKTTKRVVKRKTKKPARKKKGVVKTLNDWGNLAANKKAHWKAYWELRTRIDRAWKKLQKDAEKRAYPKLVEDQKELLLLMGECNYMLQECIRLRDNRSQ